MAALLGEIYWNSIGRVHPLPIKIEEAEGVSKPVLKLLHSYLLLFVTAFLGPLFVIHGRRQMREGVDGGGSHREAHVSGSRSSPRGIGATWVSMNLSLVLVDKREDLRELYSAGRSQWRIL
jgi:hypothetical protein